MRYDGLPFATFSLSHDRTVKESRMKTVLLAVLLLSFLILHPRITSAQPTTTLPDCEYEGKWETVFSWHAQSRAMRGHNGLVRPQ